MHFLLTHSVWNNGYEASVSTMCVCPADVAATGVISVQDEVLDDKTEGTCEVKHEQVRVWLFNS